jgi:hypothetical protein
VETGQFEEKWNVNFGSWTWRTRKGVTVTENALAVDLIEGRTIVFPLVWYPRRLDALPEQRRNWHTSAARALVSTGRIDEDPSTAGLLRGTPAAECVWTRALPPHFASAGII